MKKDYSYPAIITILALVLRVSWAGWYDLWYDEAFCLYISRFSMKEILNGIVLCSYPPLFFILLHFWDLLFNGIPELFLRLLPIFFGTATIPMLYKLGRDALGREEGLTAAFLLAVSPLHIYYSLELKPYSMLIFWAFYSVFLLFRALKYGGRYWVYLSLINVLVLYTHYFGIYLLAAEALYVFTAFLSTRKGLRQIFLSMLLSFVLFLPQMWVLIRIHMPETISFADNWMPPVSFIMTYMIFKDFAAGYHSTRILYMPLLFLYLSLALTALIFHKKRKHAWSVACFLLIPILLAAIIGQFMTPMYISRYFLFCLPFFVLLVGAGLKTIKLRKVKQAALLIIIAIHVPLIIRTIIDDMPYHDYPYHYGAHEKKEFKAAVEFIENNRRSGDVIVHACLNTFFPYKVYSDSDEMSCVVEYEASDMDLHYGLCTADYEQLAEVAPRVWLLYSAWEPALYKDEIAEVKSCLDRNMKRAVSRPFKGVTVILYNQKEKP